jgi:hypothetical protein
MDIAHEVVSPNIFDAHVHPDLVLPLVLANLLSQQLWDFSARIMSRVEKNQADPTQTAADPEQMEDDLAPALREVQRQIDRHFEHLTHERVIEINGTFDLRDERARLGAPAVNAALENIVSSFIWRESRGTARGTESIRQCIDTGKFPAYTYATFDVVRANRKGVRHRKHVPMGLTSCLDEVAIFAALVMTLPVQTVDTVVILASPAHYTAFGWNPAGQTWWFYGKNALFSERQWHKRVAQQYEGDAQLAFEDCLPFADRLISIHGTYNFTTGRGSIPVEVRDEILTKIDQFFGIRLSQIAEALKQPLTVIEPSVFAPMFRQLLGVQSIDHAREQILVSQAQIPDLLTQTILLSYRTLAVSDLSPYLIAARNSPACRRLSHTLLSVQDAMTVVQNITGRDSIFNDRERLAMPEETLRLDTGSDRDCALLLHVLIECMYDASGRSDRLETLLTQDDSFLVGPDFCISIGQLALTEIPKTGVIGRIADW